MLLMGFPVDYDGAIQTLTLPLHEVSTVPLGAHFQCVRRIKGVSSDESDDQLVVRWQACSASGEKFIDPAMVRLASQPVDQGRVVAVAR